MLKQLILKVPGMIFFILYFIFYLFWALSIEVENNLLIHTLQVLPYFVLFSWTISLVAYMAGELPDKKNVNVVYLLQSVSFLCFMLSLADLGDSDYFSTTIMLFLGFSLHLVTSIFLTSIIKRVFYARTTWFLFIELLFTPIGFVTLTPDVVEWENGDKK